MTAINFPDAPAVDDQFTAGGKVWTWDGTVWNASPDIDTITQQVTSNIVAGAPSTLDTLNELAAALGDDEDFAATVTTALSEKAPLESPTFTGTVDFSEATVTGIDALPDQTDNSGKYLTTDGTDASWTDTLVDPTIEVNYPERLFATLTGATEGPTKLIGFFPNTNSLRIRGNSSEPSLLNLNVGHEFSVDDPTLTKIRFKVLTKDPGAGFDYDITTEIVLVDAPTPSYNLIQAQVDVQTYVGNPYGQIAINWLTGTILTATVTPEEIRHLDGITSGIQSQINAKANATDLDLKLNVSGGTITGNLTVDGNLKDSDWTASRALVSDVDGNAVTSDVTSTELGYLSGVTSAIQTQIDRTKAMSVALTPPANPATGDMWWESDTSKLFIRYDGYWVEAVPRIQGPQGPQGQAAPVRDGLTAGTAVRFPSDLERAGNTSSGNYWLMGKESTPIQMYCYYDGTRFWARTSVIPRGSVLNVNGYTTNLGATDYTLANTTLAHLRLNLFGNADGSDLYTMCRIVGGTFTGAVATTPGRGPRWAIRGAALSTSLNGTATGSTSTNGYTCTILRSQGDQFPGGEYTIPSANTWQTTTNWVWSASGTGGDALWNSGGWLIHTQTANSRRADEIYMVTSNDQGLQPNSNFTRLEIYVRI